MANSGPLRKQRKYLKRRSRLPQKFRTWIINDVDRESGPTDALYGLTRRQDQDRSTSSWETNPKLRIVFEQRSTKTKSGNRIISVESIGPWNIVDCR